MIKTYFVKVKHKDEKRYLFLAPNGGLTSLRIYASRFTGERAKQNAEIVVNEILAKYPNCLAKIQELK